VCRCQRIVASPVDYSRGRLLPGCLGVTEEAVEPRCPTPGTGRLSDLHSVPIQAGGPVFPGYRPGRGVSLEEARILALAMARCRGAANPCSAVLRVSVGSQGREQVPVDASGVEQDADSAVGSCCGSRRSSDSWGWLVGMFVTSGPVAGRFVTNMLGGCGCPDSTGGRRAGRSPQQMPQACALTSEEPVCHIALSRRFPSPPLQLGLAAAFSPPHGGRRAALGRCLVDSSQSDRWRLPVRI